MNKKTIVIGVVILVLVLLAIVLFSSQSTQPLSKDVAIAPTLETTTPQNIPTKVLKELSTPVETLSSNSKGIQLNIYNILVTEKGFSAPELVVKKGTIVQLNMINKTTSPIDVSSQTLGLGLPSIASGTTATISIDASKEGNFEITCDELCPRGVKLLGKLVIQ